MEGEHSSLHLVLLSFLPLWSLLLCFLYALAIPESLCWESAERCMPASPHSDNTLPRFHSMLNQPTGMLQDMCLCTNSWEMIVNLALCCVCGERLCLWWDVHHFVTTFGVYPVATKKKKRKIIFPSPAAALADPQWLNALETSQAGIVGSQIWFAIILLVLFLFILLFMTASKLTLRRLAGSLFKDGSSFFSHTHHYIFIQCSDPFQSIRKEYAI